MHIIDDVAILCATWSPVLMSRWYKIIRLLISTAGLPISLHKSSLFSTPVTTQITFISLNINLTSTLISHNSDKISQLLQDISNYDKEQIVIQT